MNNFTNKTGSKKGNAWKQRTQFIRDQEVGDLIRAVFLYFQLDKTTGIEKIFFEFYCQHQSPSTNDIALL